MTEVDEAIGAAATHAHAAVLAAEIVAAERPGLATSSLVLSVAAAAGLLGDPSHDPATAVGDGSCAGHLLNAAAELDAIPAGHRPPELLVARGYLAEALRATQPS